MQIKVLGLGVYMQGDDEIGLEIVRRWEEAHGADFLADQIEVDCLESPGLNLLGTIAGLDAAVLVDAVQSGAPAGTVIQLSEDDIAADAEGSGSWHGWGAAETLSLGRELAGEDLPETIIIIGVEGAVFSLGEGLSPAVRNAIPSAVELVSEVVRGLLGKVSSKE